MLVCLVYLLIQSCQGQYHSFHRDPYNFGKSFFDRSPGYSFFNDPGPSIYGDSPTHSTFPSYGDSLPKYGDTNYEYSTTSTPCYPVTVTEYVTLTETAVKFVPKTVTKLAKKTLTVSEFDVKTSVLEVTKFATETVKNIETKYVTDTETVVDIQTLTETKVKTDIRTETLTATHTTVIPRTVTSIDELTITKYTPCTKQIDIDENDYHDSPRPIYTSFKAQEVAKTPEIEETPKLDKSIGTESSSNGQEDNNINGEETPGVQQDETKSFRRRIGPNISALSSRKKYLRSMQ